MITKNLLDDANRTMPEQGLSYITKPEGEMDMLIGFFLMNGVCIVFFLLFGMCVIFSCMRRRPKAFRAPAEEIPAGPIQGGQAAPTFKSLVNKAMKSPNLARLRAANEVQASKRNTTVCSDGNQIEVHVMDEKSSERCSPGQNPRRKPLKQTIVVDETIFPREERKSVIRENLLGPLSFDDLYYT